MAQAGEFTLRAFLNGKLDLSQAEAVADLIASDNEASHQIAMQHRAGIVVADLRVVKSEAIVVFGRDDKVLHPGIGCRFRPCIRVIEVRIEVVKVGCVLRIGHFFPGF